MKNVKKALIIIAIFSSTSIFTFRGRWAMYAAGKNSSNNYSGPTIDKSTDHQIKRHETAIKKHQAEINKINKNKKIDDTEKETRIQNHQAEIEKREKYINDLLTN